MTTQEDKDRNDLIAALIRRAGPRSQPSAALESQVRAAAFTEWQQLLRRERLRHAAGWLAAAAVAALAMTIGWNILAPTAPAPTIATIEFNQGDVRVNAATVGKQAAEIPLHSGDDVGTKSSGGARLAFGNGASLRLAANTRLHWRDAQNLELLSGSIYVDSGTQQAPLRITTKLGIVSHLGTRYRVRLSGDALNLGVRDGRVEVTGKEGKAIADAGQEFKLEKDGRVTRNPLTPFGDDWAWVDTLAPRFEIENRSLADFLTWASRETGRTLEYANAETEAAAARTTLHGSSASLTPREALGAIVPTTDFVARADGRRIVVSRR